MRIHPCISAAALVSICGLAHAQTKGGNDRSATGEVLVREWRLGAGETLRIGKDGGIGAADLTPVFVPAGSNPEADSHASVAYLPNGSAVVLANRASKNLSVIDPLTRTHLRTIPLSGSPQSVAVTPDGSRAVSANLFEGTASIVDLATGGELFTIPVGANPVMAKITPDGTLAVVSCNGPQNMKVIDVATGAVVRTIATGGYQTIFSINFESQGVGFQSTGPTVVDNTTVLYPDYSNSRVLVIDITTGTVTPVTTDVNPTGIAAAAGKAYITHYFPSMTVTKLDIATRTVDTTFTMPSQNNGPISVNPAGTVAVVAVQNACVAVNTATGAMSGLLGTASVNQLLTTADGNYALAVGFNGSLISYATQSIVGNSNQFVSCTIGAVSPVAQRAVMFSDTFGEDMVVVETDATPALINAGPTGPAPEGDKTRVAALTPSGSKAIGINQFSQTATVVNVASATPQGLANVGRRPGGVAITPDGTKAIVANRDGAAVSVVNLATLATTDIPISTRGDQVQISPNGQYAYIAVVVSDGVWRVDLNTNTVAGPKITTGNMGGYFQQYNAFSGMTLSHNGGTLVTCDSFDNRISVIDTATWSLVAAVPLGAGAFPVRAVFSPDDSKIYITHRDNDRISVVSNAGAGSAVTGTILVGDMPTEMVMSPDGSRIYVMNTGTPTNIGVVNTATLAQTSTISFAANPTIDGMAMSPDGSRLQVAHSNGLYTIGMGGFTIAQNFILSTVDTATNSEIGTLSGPNLASGLAMAGNGSALAMPNLMSEGLTLVDLGSCYANCDGSTGSPALTANDFQCFINKYAAGDPYANCDGSTGTPALTANDFQCFIDKYAGGCP